MSLLCTRAHHAIDTRVFNKLAADDAGVTAGPSSPAGCEAPSHKHRTAAVSKLVRGADGRLVNGREPHGDVRAAPPAKHVVQVIIVACGAPRCVRTGTFPLDSPSCPALRRAAAPAQPPVGI